MEFDISPPVSPVKHQTPQQTRRPSPMQTPGSVSRSSQKLYLNNTTLCCLLFA